MSTGDADAPRELRTETPPEKLVIDTSVPSAPPSRGRPATDDLVRGAPVPDRSVTPLVHFYRAEVGRGDVWRQRMDATTNWAIGTTAAVVSVAFSRPDIPHVLVPLGGVIVFLLLCIEGRRYRFYDVWRQRTRLIEAHFIVPFLLHDRALPPGAWREDLASGLLQPAYTMSFWRATGSRLRRNYIWIFLLLLFCWFARVAARVGTTVDGEVVFAGERPTFGSLVDGFAYGPLSGWTMLSLVALFYAALGVWMWWCGRSPDPDAMVYTRTSRGPSKWVF